MIKDRMNKGYRMGMNIGWILSISSPTSVHVWGNKNMQIRANFWVNYVEKKETFFIWYRTVFQTEAKLSSLVFEVRSYLEKLGIENCCSELHRSMWRTASTGQYGLLDIQVIFNKSDYWCWQRFSLAVLIWLKVLSGKKMLR